MSKLIGLVLLAGAACALFALARSAVRGFDLFARGEWQGDERITILLLGVDEREVDAGPWRTDTLIVLSLDPATRTAGVLSLPRDLWVTIPGYDTQSKLNTAHFIGEAQDYPGGGPALALATVQHNLGIPVQYYLRLNFSAFEKLIDLIGGIDILVDRAIDDPQYPDSGFGYEPLHIEAGLQRMDGRLALKYARTRYTELGDFDRMRHQQQVILAVRDRVTQANLLPTLIGQAEALWQTFGDSIQTNLTLDQLIRLANLAAQIDPANVELIVIDPSMTMAFVAPTNPPQNALLPVPDELRKVRDRLLGAAAPAETPSATTSTMPYVVQPGDTLFSLAQRFGTSVEAITAANGLADAGIRAGQQLIIPAPAASPSP